MIWLESVAIAFLMSITYRSIDVVKCGSHDGVSTIPKVVVSAISGVSVELPEVTV